jgi:hypothetical protein
VSPDAPTPPSKPKSRFSIAQILLIPAGALIFIVVNVLLFLGRCSSNEFMINCAGRSGDDTGLVIGIAAALVIGALVSRYGRSFATVLSAP